MLTEHLDMLDEAQKVEEWKSSVMQNTAATRTFSSQQRQRPFSQLAWTRKGKVPGYLVREGVKEETGEKVEAKYELPKFQRKSLFDEKRMK